MYCQVSVPYVGGSARVRSDKDRHVLSAAGVVSERIRARVVCCRLIHWMETQNY
jgi:hypothetical protein